MLKKLYIYILLLFFCITIYSNESADLKISKELFKFYGDDITLEQLQCVLEYDNKNKDALIKNAELLNDSNVSLHKVRAQLEIGNLYSIQSKYLYITVLYRLGEYKEVIQFASSFEIENVNDKNILLYLAESYYRTNNLQSASHILNIGLHQFPLNNLFIELKYLISRNKDLLDYISTEKQAVSSFIRLYNRVQDYTSKMVVEYYLINELKKIGIDNLNNFVGNYSVLPLLFSIYPKNTFNGEFKLDCDSDNYTETFLRAKNGELEYKGVDLDNDNIIDYEVFLKNSMPTSIIFNDNILTYSKYPYVESISIGNYKKDIYYLYKNYTIKEIKSLLEPPDLTFNKYILPNLKIIKKISYINNKEIESTIYRSQDSYVKYYHLNKLGLYDVCRLFIRGQVVSGLQDIDSDGTYDISEAYREGILLGIAYSPTGENDNIAYTDKYTEDDIDILNFIDFSWWIK